MKATRPHRRRGAIFITTLGILIILSGMLLVFAQSMRTVATTSANRVDYIQADAIEQAAEHWVLAQVEKNVPDTLAITTAIAQATPITPINSATPGGGYFWILSPDPTQVQLPGFGITDEASKLNLNYINPTYLTLLPNSNMTQDLADAIADWKNPEAKSSSDGAESSYYEGVQPEPYSCKNAPYQTLEELLLVRDVTPELMWGLDVNRDGVVDDTEQQAAGANANLAAAFSGGVAAQRGIAQFLTVYSSDTNTTFAGKPRVTVNTAAITAQRAAMTPVLGASRTMEILNRTNPRVRTGPRGATRRILPAPFANLGQFRVRGQMTNDEFKKVVDLLTTNPSPSLKGLVNVNTASEAVLMCLPGIAQSDADALISYRNNQLGNTAAQASTPSQLTTVGWIYDALSPATKADGILNLITARSWQYSADIVAVSSDGRSFKRVRIVVDASALPAKIVYRRELTSLGWPLPPRVRQVMRSGQPLNLPNSNAYVAP